MSNEIFFFYVLDDDGDDDEDEVDTTVKEEDDVLVLTSDNFCKKIFLPSLWAQEIKKHFYYNQLLKRTWTGCLLYTYYIYSQ